MTQIKNFDRVSYKFRLLDTKDQPVNGLAIVLQFFNATSEVWEDFYSGTINNGTFLFDEATSPLSVTHSDFLEDNDVPQLRIVPANPIYNYTKKQVLSAVTQLTLNTTTNQLTFDFGTAYLVEKATLDSYDSFTDFILITSRVSLYSLQTQLANANATIVQLTNTNNQLVSDNNAKAQQLAAANATIAQLTATNNQLVSDNNAKAQQLAAANATITQLTNTNNQLVSDNNAKAQEIAALTLEISAKNETIASLNTQLITALSDVEEEALEIARQEVIKTNLEATIADLQRQVAELSREINFDDRPIAINALYSNLISEIDTSAANNRNGNFKLANISLKLKALVSSDEDGINAQLFGLSNTNLVNESTVSEIKFDIAPLTAPAANTGKLPNLLGLTETAVRRMLDSIGLKLNPVFQDNTKIVNGDSFKQSPVEGSPYNPNDFVTVIFSKHE